MNLDDADVRINIERDISDVLGQALTIESWSRLSGGAIQQNSSLVVRFNDGDMKRWVLRTDAMSAVKVSRTRREEFDLLCVAHAGGVRVPEPVAYVSAQVSRPAFFLMTQVEGIAAGHRLTKPGAISDPARLARELGENLAVIHNLSPRRDELTFLEDPPASPTRELLIEYRDYLEHWQARFGNAWPALEWGLQWCLERIPDQEPAALVHRDYRTGNYLVHDGRLAATLDWEFAGWGNPLEDLGWFCAPCWRFAAPANIAGGISSADEFLNGYNAIAGTRYTEQDTLKWQALAQLRWSIIALQQCERHLSGEERSLELALTGRLLPSLERDLLLLTAA